MLKRMILHNLTVFERASLSFAPGLNVFIGANSTGKTHLLKAAYSLLSVSEQGKKKSRLPTPSKKYLASAIADKLHGVFRPDELGHLVRRRAKTKKCEIKASFGRESLNIKFSFTAASKRDVTIGTLPTAWNPTPSVFLPTRELLTIFPGFVSLYDTTEIPFEETWRDTCNLLSAPFKKGVFAGDMSSIREPLEATFGGKLFLDPGGRFYVKKGEVKTEIHLVAEGYRKLAMVARLIMTGTLGKEGYLLWDEPESNLNPVVIKHVARTILQLCRHGVQVFVATHSLFLMRELDVLLRCKEFAKIGAQYFGLHLRGDKVEVEQGDNIDDVGKIDALQEELSQSDRYLKSEAE